MCKITCDVKLEYDSLQLPLMLWQVEGKGNGIKTVICNMTDVGKALYRPPTCEYKTPRLRDHWICRLLCM